MKKLLAALLAVLCLAGCSAKDKPVEPAEPPAEVQVEETPVEQKPVEEEPTAEEPPQEELTEAAPEGAIDTYAYAEILVDGLVDDTIGYSMVKPEFAGFDAAETVNAFYTKLLTQLETYTKETVHSDCLDRHCMANAFGTVLSHELVNSVELKVVYEYRVEFSDNGEEKVSVRTDVFNVQTGAWVER